MSDNTTLPDPDETREMSHAELSRMPSGSSARGLSPLITQLERLDRLIESPALLILEPQRGGELKDARLGEESGGPLLALLTPSSKAPQGICPHTFETLYGADDPSESTLRHCLTELQQFSEEGNLRGQINPLKVHLARFNHLRARCLAHVQHEVQAALHDLKALEAGHTPDQHTFEELKARAERGLEALSSVQARIDERTLLISAQLFDSFELKPINTPQVTPEHPKTQPKVTMTSIKGSPLKKLKQWRSRILAFTLALLLHPGLWVSEPSFSALFGLGGLWPIVCLACAIYPITAVPATLVSVGLSAVEPTGVLSQAVEQLIGHLELGARWELLPEAVTRWLPVALLLLVADIVARLLARDQTLRERVACLLPSCLGSSALLFALLDQLQREPLTLHSAPVLFSPYIIALVPPATAFSGALKARLTPLILTFTCAVLVSPDLSIELRLFTVSRWLELADQSLIATLRALR